VTHTKRLGRYAAATATIALLIVTAALPAAARPEGPGDPVPLSDPHHTNCPLQRVGGQLVRCDTLTGAGAWAPTWVPNQ